MLNTFVAAGPVGGGLPAQCCVEQCAVKALWTEGGCETSSLGCRSSLVGAERSLIRGDAGEGGKPVEIQTKLHRCARDDPHRRFDDLYTLVVDPAFLLVAWCRVRGKRGGARTAGVDGETAHYIEAVPGV
jgi:hypothetical protein